MAGLVYGCGNHWGARFRMTSQYLDSCDNMALGEADGTMLA